MEAMVPAQSAVPEYPFHHRSSTIIRRPTNDSAHSGSKEGFFGFEKEFVMADEGIVR